MKRNKMIAVAAICAAAAVPSYAQTESASRQLSSDETYGVGHQTVVSVSNLTWNAGAFVLQVHAGLWYNTPDSP